MERNSVLLRNDRFEAQTVDNPFGKSTSMTHKSLCIVAICLLSFSSIAQEKTDTTSKEFLSRIFLPSLDLGYQFPNSDLVSGSVRFSASIEYRFRNNNDFFLRLTYDTYGVNYDISDASSLFNTIEGNVQMTDIFLAPGYRFGGKKFRVMVSPMPGIKLYQVPTVNITGQDIDIEQESKSIFTTSILTTLEYYFDEKTAVTLSLYQNQVWKSVDYWEDGRWTLGFSVGFITSII